MLSVLALTMVLGLVAVVVVATVAAQHATTQPGTPVQPGPAATRARRHLGVVTRLAWVALVGVAAVGWAGSSSVGPFTAAQLTGLVPLAAGAAFLLVVVVGELTWPHPSGSVRHAVLVRRSMRDLLGRALPTWTGALAVALVVVLVTAGLTADDDGRSVGREVARGEVTLSTGPYPGWYYGLALLVATAALVGLTFLVLRMIMGQPAVCDVHEADDLALRRTSVRRVLAGVQAVLGVTLGGVLYVGGRALYNLGSDTLVTQPTIPADPALTGAGTVASVLGPAVAVASLVVAVVVVVTSRVTFNHEPTTMAADA